MGAMRVDQALDLWPGSPYDIVLTDLMMPDRSGMEAVQAVARTIQIPVSSCLQALPQWIPQWNR